MLRAVDVARKLCRGAKAEYLAAFEAGDDLLDTAGITHRGRKDPDIGIVVDLFNYDGDTGKLLWRINGIKKTIGKEAGSVDKVTGYRRVRAGDRSVMVHRIAWALTFGAFPVADIDHINGIRSDNRIDNLREATRSQNVFNAGARCNSKTGIRGVYKLKDCNRYRSVIRIHGVRVDLGLFEKSEDALDAYESAARVLFGKFARVRQ